MPQPTRALWLAVIVLFGVIVSGAAALVSHASGDSAAATMRTGGASFAGTVLLLIAIFYFATHNGPKP